MENVKEEMVDEGVILKIVELKFVVVDVLNGLEDKVMIKKQMVEKRKVKYMDYKVNVELKKFWFYSFLYVI